MVPDLSRSCWRKMVCGRHRRGGEGQVLPRPSSPHPRGVPHSPASCGSCSRGSGTPPAPGGRCRPSGSRGSRRNGAAEGWRSTGRAQRADPGLFRREEAFQPRRAQLGAASWSPWLRAAIPGAPSVRPRGPLPPFPSFPALARPGSRAPVPTEKLPRRQAACQESCPLPAAPRGYIHQVDHVAAGVQAEPVRLQVFV